MRKSLTDVVIAQQPAPKTGRLELHDSRVPGLALRVTSGGSKSYVVRTRIKGHPAPIRITLGDARAMTLADARQEAHGVLRQCRAGIDPREARRAQQQAEALRWETVIEHFLAQHVRQRKSGHQTEAILARHVTPRWSGRRLPEITRRDVAALLESLAAERGVYTANRALAAVRGLMNWAVRSGLIIASPVVPRMALVGEVVRDRVLTFDEIQAVWAAAGRLGYPFGALVQFLLATGQRRSETAGARWAAIDLNARVWTLEAAETKAGRRHDVPLSDLAVDLLTALPRIGGTYVFTSGGARPVNAFAQGKIALDRELTKSNGHPPMLWRLHDLRRSVATHMADALGIAPHVIGAVLNHAPVGITQRVYTRGDLAFDKRRALQAWARLLGVLIEGGPTWQAIASMLRPLSEADVARAIEFRRATQADDAVWTAYLRGIGDEH